MGTLLQHLPKISEKTTHLTGLNRAILAIQKKLSTMKAFIFCASIFLFAAANASPWTGYGLGYRSPHGYHAVGKRSDDQDVKAPATVLSSDAIADPAAASTSTAAIDDHPPKVLDKIKSVIDFLRDHNVGVVVLRKEPREVVEERFY